MKMDYKKFYEYWADFYGTGLEIANWHLNGSTEPFDNFFDAAVSASQNILNFEGRINNE